MAPPAAKAITMKEALRSHWKAKLASLLVAVAVWYLLKGHVRYQEQRNIVTDPGTQLASAGLPGNGGLWSAEPSVVPLALLATERPRAELVRTRWVEMGEFTAGIVEYPAYPCA